jgi:hypothetical protein
MLCHLANSGRNQFESQETVDYHITNHSLEDAALNKQVSGFHMKLCQRQLQPRNIHVVFSWILCVKQNLLKSSVKNSPNENSAIIAQENIQSIFSISIFFDFLFASQLGRLQSNLKYANREHSCFPVDS